MFSKTSDGNSRPDWIEGGKGHNSFNLDSDRQTLTQGLNFSQETRPKSKFFSLLIYAGYPIL